MKKKAERKMWYWYLIAAPFVLVLVLNIVGRFLPETYTAKGRMVMGIPPAELWARLHDPMKFPMSGKMCKKVEQLPSENGLAVWIEDLGQSKLRIRNADEAENQRLVRILEDTVVPFTGHTEFTIEAAGEGCVVTCSNKSTIKDGTWHVPFFRVMVGLFGGTRSGCKDYLTRLSGGTGKIEWLE